MGIKLYNKLPNHIKIEKNQFIKREEYMFCEFC